MVYYFSILIHPFLPTADYAKRPVPHEDRTVAIHPVGSRH